MIQYFFLKRPRDQKIQTLEAKQIEKNKTKQQKHVVQ